MILPPYLKIAGLAILAATGCGKALHPHSTAGSLASGDSGHFSANRNAFAFRLFDQVITRDAAGSNRLVSPLSVYLALSMVYNGSAGSTREEMATTLGLGDTPLEDVNQDNKTLLKTLPAEDPSVALEIANSIWYRANGAQPLASFLDVTRQDYLGQVSSAAFDASTVNDINSWVREKTHDKINSIIDEINPMDVMYLVNAVYFKGAWCQAFDSAATADRIFHGAGRQEVKVPFMHREARYNYLDNDSAQLIELPYGNGVFSMYVALPAAGTAPEAWLKAQGAAGFSALVSSMDSAKVELSLPKWKYAYKVNDLKGVLTSLGMGEAFTRKANFTNMYPPSAGVYISQALHKAFIEVNEQGTEAAAVTSIGMKTLSMPAHPTPAMVVDRPFCYFITEKPSGTILFMGIVSNPSDNG